MKLPHNLIRPTLLFFRSRPSGRLIIALLYWNHGAMAPRIKRIAAWSSSSEGRPSRSRALVRAVQLRRSCHWSRSYHWFQAHPLHPPRTFHRSSRDAPSSANHLDSCRAARRFLDVPSLDVRSGIVTERRSDGQRPTIRCAVFVQELRRPASKLDRDAATCAGRRLARKHCVGKRLGLVRGEG